MRQAPACRTVIRLDPVPVSKTARHIGVSITLDILCGGVDEARHREDLAATVERAGLGFVTDKNRRG